VPSLHACRSTLEDPPFGLDEEAACIEGAVERALNDGLRCKDIASDGATVLGTREMGAAVIERL
jgi:Isocitrate/isopropylmalate dehydrogenase.